MSPETWRVVFSSTGDLVRTATEVRLDNPRNALSMRATRAVLRAMRSALDSLAVVLLPSNFCVCALCRRTHPEFDFAVSLGAHDSVPRKLIHLLKYEQLRPAANVLEARTASVISERAVSGTEPVLLIPVPLHRIKHRRRGFNQSQLIVHSLLLRLDRSRSRVHIGNLGRVRETVSQLGLTRQPRRENVRRAFVVTNPAAVGDRAVGLIDDVYTTGTTLNESAHVARVYRERIGMKIVGSNAHGASFQTQEEHAAIRAVAG